MPRDLQNGELLVRPQCEDRADGAVGHRHCPVVIPQEIDHARRQFRDGSACRRVVEQIVRDRQAEKRAGILVRDVPAQYRLPSCRCRYADAVVLLFLNDAGGQIPIHRDRTAGQQVRAGHIHEEAEGVQSPVGVRQSRGVLCDLVAVRLRREVVARQMAESPHSA